MKALPQKSLPKIGFLYLDHVLRFFDKSNFRGWPDKIESVVYHWRNDKQRFIEEVKRKKIEVLIGNVPATAYETFREISRALPNVQFIPSLDTQFANKSKENVTQLCEKYNIPIPKTEIFYELKEADNFLKHTDYPKIIKKSYGPSNYGGYFVHKVDSYQEASDLLKQKKYYPVYIQDFVPMAADIRVMLIGHKPVCAFWRRPPEGEWLTNTSQGGSMDYLDVPKQVLDLAVRVSKAANAEYWACDVAVGVDGKYRILECATAFAAFPYIRDWIGQYLMWKLSDGQYQQPHIPLYNWEELGKINSSLLRTMRYITFGRETAPTTCDGAELFTEFNEQEYPIFNTKMITQEEWPSEIWNRQDNYLANKQKAQLAPQVTEQNLQPAPLIDCEESAQSPELHEVTAEPLLNLEQVERFLLSVKGIGQIKAQSILKTLGLEGVCHALESDGSDFSKVPAIKEKKIASIMNAWPSFKLDLAN